MPPVACCQLIIFRQARIAVSTAPRYGHLVAYQYTVASASSWCTLMLVRCDPNNCSETVAAVAQRTNEPGESALIMRFMHASFHDHCLANRGVTQECTRQPIILSPNAGSTARRCNCSTVPALTAHAQDNCFTAFRFLSDPAATYENCLFLVLHVPRDLAGTGVPQSFRLSIHQREYTSSVRAVFILLSAWM